MNQLPATIAYNITGQTLVFDAPEGRPTSVTSVAVYEDTQSDDSTAETAVGSGSVAAGATTLTASAGPTQQRSDLLTLSAVTDFSADPLNPRRYLVASVHGWREWFEAIGKDTTNKYLYARTGLQNDYASGDAVVSTRMTCTVDSTWVALKSKLSDVEPWPRWRIVWTYVVSSVTYRHAAYFDLVRYPLTHSATMQDVSRKSRGILARLPAEDMGDGQAVLLEALQQVKLDMLENGHTAYAFRGSEILNELVCRRAVLNIAEEAVLHGSADPSAYERAKAIYAERLDNILGAAAKARAQRHPDGQAAPVANGLAWRR